MVYALFMCGRFTQNLSWAEIHRLADLVGQPRNLAPRFNIAPTTPIEVIRAADAGNELVPMYWALCRPGGKNRSKNFPRPSTPAPRRSPSGQCFAARSNTGAASFRLRDFTNGPARKARRRRIISRRATAGRWRSRDMDHWSGLDGGDDLPNATIIVGAANGWMQSFHDRMPIILDWRDAGAWMTGESADALLRSPPDDALREWIVSTRVNKAGAGDDDPALIEPIGNA